MQYHTISIADGGLNGSTFASSLSKVSPNENVQATLIDAASQPWQDATSDGTRDNNTSPEKATTQVTSCLEFNLAKSLFTCTNQFIIQRLSKAYGTWVGNCIAQFLLSIQWHMISYKSLNAQYGCGVRYR